MVETYLTVLAFILVTRGILYLIYLPFLRKTRLKTKGRNFILTKWFGTNNQNYSLTFWLSTLWLIVYYFEFIKEILRGLNA